MSGKARSAESARTIRDFGAAGDDGARGHYDDPAYYAKTYKDRRHDIDYYVRLARESKGPVLEYGVGNGRIALHVARAGIEVLGVDLSGPMLDDFEARLKLEPKQVRARVSLAQGDMRDYELGRRVPLVYAPFNCFLHLYTRPDVEAFLARVRAHLAPDGRFVFDFSVPPRRGSVARSGAQLRVAEDPAPNDGRAGSLRRALRIRPPAPAAAHLDGVRAGRGRQAWKVPLTHRQFFPREVEALLHYNGFTDIFFTADFTDQPADQWVDSMVVSCRVAAAKKPPRRPLVRRPKLRAAAKKKLRRA